MMKVADRIEMRAVADLVPYARNARTHSAEQVAQIARSIREFGFTNPVLVDGGGGIVAGHGRVMAAKSLGLASVPVLCVDWLTDAQQRAYVLADNRLALDAGWDDALLAGELAALKADGFDLELTGFADDEIADLLESEGGDKESEGRPDSTPEPPAHPVTAPGDVWIMGRHRVMCGDSTSAESWDALDIDRPACVFTSPPYGLGENAKLRDHYVPGAETRKSLYATHKDSPDEWLDLMRAWTNMALTTVDCVVCNVQTLANNKRNVMAWSADYVNHLVDVAVWDKGAGAPQMQSNVLTNVFEWLFILAPNKGASRSLPLADFHGTESNVVRVGRGQREYSDIHRATMPLELAEWAVRVPGAKAKCIVDPFGGTGTTLIAAEKHGKKSALIELDPRYVDVIIRRWQAFTGARAVHAVTGQPFPQS